MDLAIISGLAAARSIIDADSPARIGDLYRRNLEDRLLASQRVYQGFYRSWQCRAYPDLANDILRFLFRMDGAVPKPMLAGLWQIVRRHVSPLQLAGDGWKVVRQL
jgi:electron transfer flavoprotein-quinone oxidoreductase